MWSRFSGWSNMNGRAGRSRAGSARAVFLGGVALASTATLGSASPELAAPIPNPSPVPSAWFGRAVAASDRGFLIGAPGYSDETGEAFVYSTDGTMQRRIPNPEPAPFESFADAAAISDEWVIVGASHDLGGGNGLGSVRAYTHDGELRWTFLDPYPFAGDRFGFSVALSGNLLAIGVPQDQGSNGSVFVFDLESGLREHHLPAVTGAESMGWSVAIGDGLIAAGAPYAGDPVSGLVGGAVHLFDAATGVHVDSIFNPDAGQNDRFGETVAIAGGRILIGAPADKAPDGIRVGYVHVYDAVSLAPILAVENPRYSDPLEPLAAQYSYFGSSLAATPKRFVAGAYAMTPGGAAWLFHWTSAGLLTYEIANPTPGPGGNDNFGQSVALAPGRLLIGAPADTTPDYGAAFLYRVAPIARNQRLWTLPETSIAITLSGEPFQSGASLVYSVGTAAHGALSGAAPALVYAPEAGFVGFDEFAFSVREEPLESDDGTVSIAVDTPPEANPDVARTGPGVPVDVDVLANDVDADLDELSVSIIGAPVFGTAEVTTSGRIRYVPAANFVGTDRVDYEASDWFTSASTHVMITVGAEDTDGVGGDGGCSCRIASRGGGSASAGVAVLVVGLIVLRRSRLRFRASR